MVKSVFMEGTMESETKHHEKKKQSLKGKKVLYLPSHDHTMQYWRGSIVSSLINSESQSVCYLTIRKCFQLLGNTHWP